MAFFPDSVRQTVPRWLLLLLRLVVGSVWLGTGWWWITHADAAAAMSQQITNVMEAGRHYRRWYEPFLRVVVLPNVSLFAFLVSWGEFLTGVSITCGST